MNSTNPSNNQPSVARLGMNVLTGQANTPGKPAEEPGFAKANVASASRKTPTFTRPRSLSTREYFERKTNPTVRFTPYAYAKLRFLRDLGPTEVGGFGVCPNDPLLVEDFQTLAQECSSAFVAFDDTAVADYTEDMIDRGLRPDQFFRIWIHTHPGNSASPSGVDEETFSRVFGGADWAVMYILARGGESYARLRFNTTPGGQTNLSDAVDWCADKTPAFDHEAWEAEYVKNVFEKSYSYTPPAGGYQRQYGGYQAQQGGYQYQGYGGGGYAGGYHGAGYDDDDMVHTSRRSAGFHQNQAGVYVPSVARTQPGSAQRPATQGEFYSGQQRVNGQVVSPLATAPGRLEDAAKDADKSTWQQDMDAWDHSTQTLGAGATKPTTAKNDDDKDLANYDFGD